MAALASEVAAPTVERTGRSPAVARPFRAGRLVFPRVDAARLSASLIVVATFYAFALCFVNTRVMSLSGSGPLIAVESVLMIVAFGLVLRRASPAGLVLCLAIAVNFCILAIARGEVDPKALRDLLMVVVFTWLGVAYGNPLLAERLLRGIACAVVAIGTFQLVAPDVYKSFFDALRFFEARGLTTDKYVLLTLLERPSGIGRSILPVLGPGRFSSVFLEPVSMGNFAVVIGAWALAKDRSEWRQAAVLLLLATAVAILADARFGVMALGILAASRWLGLWRVRWLHALFPLVGLLATVIVAWMRDGQHWSDDFMGRLLRSGEHVRNLGPGAWFGVPQEILLDAGYGYVIQEFGILMCIALWAVYCWLPMSDRGARYRFNASVYMALILSVSGSSMFAVKTAALLFFMLGCLVVHREAPTLGGRSAWLRTTPRGAVP